MERRGPRVGRQVRVEPAQVGGDVGRQITEVSPRRSRGHRQDFAPRSQARQRDVGHQAAALRQPSDHGRTERHHADVVAGLSLATEHLATQAHDVALRVHADGARTDWRGAHGQHLGVAPAGNVHQ